jgi:hypothetical protein
MAKWLRSEDLCTETSRSEIMALLGLLYLIGTRKGHHANVRELWTAVWRVTRRWPLAVFYILMNIAGINCWVIYTFNTPSDEPQRRILFLKNLPLSLMKEHLVSRSQIPSLPTDVSAFLEEYRPLPVEDDGDGIAGRPPKKRGRCFICGLQKNSSASMKCDQ